MKVVVFGGSGMIGRGVLRECELDPGVGQIALVSRRPTGPYGPKVSEIVHENFEDFAPIESRLTGYDACFYCLGVSSAGMSEAEYTRVTYDYTVAAATVLSRANPTMTFVFVSGAGSDDTEKGKVMWARVKGRAENAVRKMPFKAVYVFRPGFIQPMHGARSRTRSYRILYAVMWPLFPLVRALGGTTTERVGRAMLVAAREGAPTPILGNREINALAARAPAASAG